MKIGVIACGFQCDENFERVIQPWIEAKSSLAVQDIDLRIGVVSSMFKEYAEIGVKPTDNESTIKLIEKHVEHFHCASYSPDLPLEEEAAVRSRLVDQLELGSGDLLWILDLQDELYTVQDIENIVRFIKVNHSYSSPAYYRINFKNYVFDEKHWVAGFCPSRIFWADRHGGIKRFVWDNDIEYNDGTLSTGLLSQEIPQKVAFVKHLSWCGSPERLMKKVEYQLKHFKGQCSYKWNYDQAKLEFDMDFYQRHGMQVPHVYEEK